MYRILKDSVCSGSAGVTCIVMAWHVYSQSEVYVIVEIVISHQCSIQVVIHAVGLQQLHHVLEKEGFDNDTGVYDSLLT